MRDEHRGEHRTDRIHDVNDGKIERAKERALGKHEGPPDTAGLVGHAAGGVTGALTGAAVGSAGGPVGTVIGTLAGALGGWWAGRAIAEAAEALTEEDEEYYREHYESKETGPADRAYEHARPAYHLGHVASRNPEWEGREWEEVEPHLRRGWSEDVSRHHGQWESMRRYVREGFRRGGASREGNTARDTTDVGNVGSTLHGIPSARPGAPMDSGRSTARGTDESL